MTQNDKELLIKDLCARLPYGVKCKVNYIINNESTYGEDVEKECTDIVKRINFDTYSIYTEWLGYESDIEDIKPYLRPLSFMTKEECIELGNINATIENISEVIPNVPYYIEVACSKQIDWLNEHHFDYRGLIEKGLAIAVAKDNNPYYG